MNTTPWLYAPPNFGAAQPSTVREHFRMLHATHSSIEVLKWVLGFVLTARLLFRRTRRLADQKFAEL
jgi:hypothetical protein